MKLLAIAFTFAAAAVCLTSLSGALMCYTCSYVLGQNGEDVACITAPTSHTNCTKKYCTIVRQELRKPPGKVVSFQRNCEDKPMFLDTIKEDASFKMFYRSCATDFCNGADGIHSLLMPAHAPAASPNLVVKGKVKVKAKDASL